LRNAGKGVVTFSVRFGDKGHRLYATIGRAGNLIIRDPATRQVFSSVDALRKAFGAGATLRSSEIIFVASSLLVPASHLAQGLSEWAITFKTLAFQVIPIVPVKANVAQPAVQVLTVREAAAAQTLPAAPHSKVHTVRPGDWLSKLAQTYYG